MLNPVQALRSGQTILGTWLNSGSPILAELLAQSGFDFVCLDAEHSAVDLPQAQPVFQAITSGAPDCAAFVRLHGLDYAFVKRYLDAGVRGVICPLITTADEAKRLVEAVKYPPQGKRGVGFCRANAYGARLQEHFDRANDEILTAVQIEDIAAVNNIDAILGVPGIHAAFIGPYDLSASMGITAKFDHPDYLRARDRILAACQAHGIFPGLHVVAPNPPELIARQAEGYRLIAYSLDITMVQHACRTAFAAFKEAGLR